MSATPNQTVDNSWPNEPERVTFNIPEVATMLGVSRGAAYRWAREGEIPSLRVGRRLVVPCHAFRQWLNSNTGPHSAVPLGDVTGTVHDAAPDRLAAAIDSSPEPNEE